MNAPILRSWLSRPWILLCVTAACLLGFSAAVTAAPVQRKLLKLTLAEDSRSATLVVPAGCNSVTLQRYVRPAGWSKVAVRKVQPGKVTLKLPPAPKQTRWRAIGTFPAKPPQRKFPDRFYKGKNQFEPVKSGSGPGFPYWNLRTAGIDSPPMVADSNGLGNEDLQPAPVEADIWKTDGSLVFFFNQLRGLQVLDVSNPADPRLLATRRIHAEGEDLYLLPDSDGGKNLLLITRHQTEAGDPFTRFRTIRFAGGKLTVLHRREVAGVLADSRMAGDRLFLATTTWAPDKDGMNFWQGTSTTVLSQWFVPLGQEPRAAGTFSIPGDSPIIAAGRDWLAVTVTPSGQWAVSEVTVFSLGKTGLIRLNGRPLRTAGRIADKFKLQWRDHVLTTISERNQTDDWTWRPTTVLENFRVWGPDVIRPAVVTDPLMASLELAAGESLYATRFAGDKAYVVTFLQTDPLWVVDLSDPAKPTVAGHLEIPGWSTYLEPIGDLLFSVGFESGTVAASLFDVADPAAPTLLRRVNLGKQGSFSEATWDEQALRVLPEAGLALIPLTSYDETSGGTVASVQLLDLDLTARDLRPRGAIRHAFDARRSTLLGDNTVISISQRVMVAAGIADRDQPAILSEVSLAWPVDFLVDGGNHLIQIESGAAWLSGRATARISPAADTEAILAETDLGEGTVRDAELRGGKLYVLRQMDGWRRFYPWHKTSDDGGPEDALHLDIYDATALPLLTRTGGCSIPIQPGQSLAASGLCWPHEHRPCVLLQAPSGFWWYGWDFPGPVIRPLPVDTVMSDGARTLSAAISPVLGDAGRMIRPYPYPEIPLGDPPQLVAMDVTDPAAPVAGDPVNLGAAGTTITNVVEAADGLVVTGSSHRRNWLTGKQLPYDETLRSLLVAVVPATGSPRVRVPIDLPGDLIAVTELDRRGFLAFTRGFDGQGGSRIQVSASDGVDAFEVASLDAGPGAVAVSGRRVFVAGDRVIKRHLLGDQGTFVSEPDLPTRWSALSLRVTGGVLLGSTPDRLLASAPDAGEMRNWYFRQWSLNLESIGVAADGDLLAPLGEHGARRIFR